METQHSIDGISFANMVKAGAMNLRIHEQEVNDLNVFPIPDGDTGSNMLLTVMGGFEIKKEDISHISVISRRIADGMLLSARGNSGVILSQLFNGMAKGFEGLQTADGTQFFNALKSGVEYAYNAVVEPTEGTILTVARLPLERIGNSVDSSVIDLIKKYIVEAKAVLRETPEMLSVLKKAGVIDSGGAGFIYIFEGMSRFLCGDFKDNNFEEISDLGEKKGEINLDLFTADDQLQFGYCTELLLRLQHSKTKVEEFEVKTITDYMQTIGDSVVAFKNGSIVKLHVHTMTPDKVLAFCQKYGEFLTVKIENMCVQHNETKERDNAPEKEKQTYGLVAVCSGDGVKQMFLKGGVDVIVDGGQSMNPSTEDFINAFKKINAETIFVLPNNGNVILAAKQAANFYKDGNVRVLNSKTVGDGYVALSMMNPDLEDANEVFEEMTEAMEGVVTAEVTRCIRDAEMSEITVKKGEYVGIVGKEMIASANDAINALCKTLESLPFSDYDSCIVIKGKDAFETDENLQELLESTYPRKEFYFVDGMQDIYDYLLIIQ